MKLTDPLPFLVVLCALLFAGCATSTTQYNESPITVSIPLDLPKDKALKAMIQTFVGRQWTIAGRTDNSVTANIQHKTYDTNVTMKIEGQSIVFYATSVRSRYQAGKRVVSDEMPIGWLENLRKDLQGNLQIAQFSN